MNNPSKTSTDDHTSNKGTMNNASTDDTSINTSHDHNQNREHNKESKTAAAAQLYNCTYCKRGFTTAQALGGHMNIHRKDRAKTTQIINASSSSGELAQRPLELRLFDDKPKRMNGDWERSKENEATDELDLTLRLGHEK